MPISSDEFIHCAEQLMLLKSEIGYRSAMSRSYYAIYHTASLVAEQKSMDLVEDERSTHKRLFMRFEKNGYKKYGDMLKMLHKKRVKADYRITEDLSGREAVVYLNECKQFYGKLQALYG